MNQSGLEQWARQAPDRAVLTRQEAQDTLGWSFSALDEALQTLRQQHAFYVGPECWVNPWVCLSPEAVAAQLRPRGYFSAEWALAWHGCLSQQPTRLTIVDATPPPLSPQVLFGSWSLECLPPVFAEDPPPLSYPPRSLPVAAPERALVEWAAYRWRGDRRDALADFLDDCDREVVEEPLRHLAAESSVREIRRLAQVILDVWPADSRWPGRLDLA